MLVRPVRVHCGFAELVSLSASTFRLCPWSREGQMCLNRIDRHQSLYVAPTYELSPTIHPLAVLEYPVPMYMMAALQSLKSRYEEKPWVP